MMKTIEKVWFNALIHLNHDRILNSEILKQSIKIKINGSLS